MTSLVRYIWHSFRMRADRLLQLLALLRRHGRLSARRLAELLEVSERTILRDMEALSAAGVPVYTDRGRGGGCALLEGYRTEVSGLSPGEAQALFAWTSGTAAAELGLGGELSSALTKLSATVPAPALETAETLASVVITDRRRWFDAAEQVPLLPVLRDAVTGRRRVTLTYRTASEAAAEAPSVRTVDPYGLVENAGRWYLLAGRDGEPRTYRVSRIVAAEVLDEASSVPEGFNLAEAWERQRAAFEQQARPWLITVAVHPDAVDFFCAHARFQLAAGTTINRVGSDEAGWPVLELSFRAGKAAVAIVLAHGDQARLLSPEALRQDVIRLARESLAVHAAE